MQVELKTCRKCGEAKPLSSFHRNKTKPDGLAYMCKECTNAYYKSRRPETRERQMENNRQMRRRYKQRALEAYGSKCECCGETEPAFLCIDHVNGGGNQHRAELKQAGTDLYKWLKKEGYPPGFRVLCWNCNAAIGMYGHCPHEESKS